jgi:hypothetical protein
MKKHWIIVAVLVAALAGCGSSHGTSDTTVKARTLPANVQEQPELVIDLSGDPAGSRIGGVQVILSLPVPGSIDTAPDGTVLNLTGAGMLSIGSYKDGRLCMITIDPYGILSREVFRVPVHSTVISIVSVSVIDVMGNPIPGVSAAARIQ